MGGILRICRMDHLAPSTCEKADVVRGLGKSEIRVMCLVSCVGCWKIPPPRGI